jgi:hypothetical protein
MKPQPLATQQPGHRSEADDLALTLLMVAPDQNVRVLEALAACLVNRASRTRDALPPRSTNPARSAEVTATGALAQKLEITRRIARRALRGSLADPTEGATAFHRIEATPAWSQGQLPVAIVGGFLSYRLAAGGPTDELVANGESVPPGR